MCATLLIAAAGVMAAGALGGMVASISSANANKKAADYEALMETRQLYRQQEQQHIAALQKENARADEYNQGRSSALAAIGAAGLGEHISFFQSADPEARKRYLQDVGTIRLNLDADRSNVTDQVGVTEYKRRIGGYNAQMSKVGAVADFVKTAMQAATMMGSYGTPSPAGAGGGAGTIHVTGGGYY